MCIFGATSAIAQGAARTLAERGCELVLVGRDLERIESVAEDIRARSGAQVTAREMDFDDLGAFAPMLEEAKEIMGTLDSVLVAHGVLGDQAEAERDFSIAEEILRVNLLSVIAICTEAANQFEQQGYGDICVISSVAGDRGRQSNYIYGTAKGAVNIFLQGLRNRLYPHGVHVLCVKPGFVSTPMTAHLKQGPLFANPDDIGRQLVDALTWRENEVYLPRFWRPIMSAIRAVPEPFFKRLKL